MLMARRKFTPSQRGTGTLVVTKRILISNRERSGPKAMFPSAIGVAVGKGPVPFIDENNLGLSGTIGRFSLRLRKGAYVSIKDSANNFASYVLRGNTIGICSISIKRKRLS